MPTCDVNYPGFGFQFGSSPRKQTGRECVYCGEIGDRGTQKVAVVGQRISPERNG